MRRSPTTEDHARFEPVVIALAKAQEALVAADVMLGQVIVALDGGDHASLDAVVVWSRLIEQARMALATAAENPVEAHWAGTTPDGRHATSYSWRLHGRDE
jgi:hypothetical protein